MSAKAANKRTTFPIELLPDELLTEILRHATRVPYGINASDLVVKRLQSAEAIDTVREYKRSLVTKRYLVLVCKRWYWIALPCLYEWIQTIKLKSLSGLVNTVARTTSNETQHHATVGWCTKRLDIDFHQTGAETIEQFDDINALVLRLLHNIPNLEVLTIGECFRYLWMGSAVHDWCPKLKYLNWIHDSGYVTSPELLRHFLKCHPDLDGFNPGMPSPPPECSPGQFTHSLRTWVTSHKFSPIPIANTFTSLKRLSVNIDSEIDHASMINMEPLPSLEELQLNIGRRDTEGWATTYFRLERIQPLFRLMSNLRRIEVVLLAWTLSLGSLIFPATVSVLGIRVCSVIPRKGGAKSFLEELNRIIEQARGPLVVQFLDRRTLDGILVHEKHIARHAKGLKILGRFLDPEGQECSIQC